MSEIVQETGNIKISDEVVSVIAGITTAEVEGVSSMGGSIAGGIAEMLGAKKNLTKGVKVDINANDVFLDLHINVQYGARIPAVAFEIQEKVKKAVEDMTGLCVQEINIHVDGVTFEKEKKQAVVEAVIEPPDPEESAEPKE